MRASTPPPPYASQARTVGQNRVTASRNHEVTVWTEQIDIDGDGIVDDAMFAYDDANKILFASKSGTLSSSMPASSAATRSNIRSSANCDGFRTTTRGK